MTAAQLLPSWLDLEPVSRRPTRLSPPAEACALAITPARVPPHRGASGPHASVIIPTQGSLVFLKLCLTSLLANTPEPSLEVVVIDNASDDGSAAFLDAFAAAHANVQVIHNTVNRGFAAATNQGLRAARGEVLVLLNDDTIPPPGWLSRLYAVLADRGIGLAGPVTNRAGNECQIDVTYRTYGELLAFARDRHARPAASARDVEMLTMFCLAMRRDVYAQLGDLDERFGLGMFEDDDYALRARASGFRVVCAENVFVHHFGATSLGKLAAAGRFGTLFDENRRRFEDKWQRPWTPHQRPPTPAYRDLIDRLQALVARRVPRGSAVAIVSRGDNALVNLPDHAGCHFPQGGDGGYAGYNPADSAAAIAALETLRASGLGYFMVPESARWWLDHYADLRRHLEAESEAVVADDAGVLYVLRSGRRHAPAAARPPATATTGRTAQA